MASLLCGDGERVSNEWQQLVRVFVPVLHVLGDGAPRLAVARLCHVAPLPDCFLLRLRYATKGGNDGKSQCFFQKLDSIGSS